MRRASKECVSVSHERRLCHCSKADDAGVKRLVVVAPIADLPRQED
jgi:hypothetical protein